MNFGGDMIQPLTSISEYLKDAVGSQCGKCGYPGKNVFFLSDQISSFSHPPNILSVYSHVHSLIPINLTKFYLSLEA